MLNYTIRRVLKTVPTIFLIITLVFFSIRLTPGGPATAALGTHATQQRIELFQERMGLDQPLIKQYLSYLYDVARGDLGNSFMTMQPVNQMIIQVLPHSLILAFSGLSFGVILGVVLGIFAAVKRNSLFDQLTRLVSLALISMPGFYLGILLMLIFAVELEWFPAIGRGSPKHIGEYLYRLILPAITVGLPTLAYHLRAARSSFLEVLSKDYVRTARAKGIREQTVYFKHVLKNSFNELLSVSGLYAIILIGSVVMIEVVYNRTGLGSLASGAVKTRDFPLIQGLMIIFGVYTSLVNLIVDLIYGFFDPRITYD